MVTEFGVGTPLVTLNGGSTTLWSQTLGCGDSFGHTDGRCPPLGHLDWSVDIPVVTGMVWTQEFHTAVVALTGYTLLRPQRLACRHIVPETVGFGHHWGHIHSELDSASVIKT